MGIPAVIHLQGEDAIFDELDEVPNPMHNFLYLRNVRKKDGKALTYITDGAEVFLYAWHRITFVEIMQDIAIPSSGMAIAASPGMVHSSGQQHQQQPAGTTVLGLFRDDK